MAIVQTALITLLVIAFVFVLVAQLGLLRGRAPNDLGAREGRLKPPSLTPNSVSSQAGLYPEHPQRRYAEIAPFPVPDSGPQGLERIRRVVESLEGAKVVKSDSGYLYVQFTSRMLKFVDDTEFWFDARQGVVQLRSASRLRRKDFGANRARIEAIRARLGGG